MAWWDRLYRQRGGGSVLPVATGSKGVWDILRLNYCLMSGRFQILVALLLNFNDENKELSRHTHGLPAFWPTEYPPGTGQGFLRQHKDHPLEAVKVWQRQARWM